SPGSARGSDARGKNSIRAHVSSKKSNAQPVAAGEGRGNLQETAKMRRIPLNIREVGRNMPLRARWLSGRASGENGYISIAPLESARSVTDQTALWDSALKSLGGLVLTAIIAASLLYPKAALASSAS